MVTPPKKKEPKTVKDVFKQFEADQKGIDNKTFAKLVADCGLVDKKMTSTDFDLLFMKLKEKGQRKIQYKTFLKALEAIAEKKGMRLSTNAMMFRRVLVSLDASNYVSQQNLLDLGLSRVLVESIEQKLRQDGVIEEEGSVNGSALEKAKQKYFGRRASKRSRDEEEIENMSRAADELHIGDQVVQGAGDGEGRGGDGGQGGRGHPGAAGDAEGQGHGRKRRKVSRARGE